jgi:signal transduction histidine kinase/CheY-like chemotaxis protein/HPt (histidine-containing phosphotransfer) domain-containing protein
MAPAAVMTRGFWTVRRQFLLLLGIMVLGAGSVLALDGIYQHQHTATFNRLYDSAIGGQATLSQLATAYDIDVIDTAFKVRAGIMTFEQGVAAVDSTERNLQQGYAALHARPMPARQAELLRQIDAARGPADATVARLRALLERQDMAGLTTLANTELFPTLDPLLNDLGLLADLKIIDAQAQLDADRHRAGNLAVWRFALSLGALVLILGAGRAFLRSLYRGIDQLVRLSQGMRSGDYDVDPGPPARGETREVVAGFLAMREEVKRKNAALRDSEARAQEATRAKSAFLAAMSHEIRTPMIGITGMLELLDGTPLNPEQRRSIAIVQASAQSLLQIIGDILDFSKIEAGRLELAPQDVDLRHLVEHTVGNYLGIASSKGLTLETSLDDALGAAYVVDPLRLRQILSNFLSNAVKFTQAGGITVGVERVATLDDGRERIALRVRDSGIGITPEQGRALFQPFAQGDSGTARRFGGTGLGLAICRQLAELMGGRIELASKPGVGSTFSLILPLAPGDPAKVEAAAEAAAAPADAFPTRPLPSVEDARREGSLVLVVDDHPTNREVLTRQLARAGFACETASEGREGLERWRTANYALVLTDIHMPHMDGYQLTAAIRKAERAQRGPRTPIIAITANVSKGEPERCLAAGMDAFIGKPVRIAHMSAVLRRWLPHVQFAAAGAAAPPPAAARLLATGAAPVDPAVLEEITGNDAALARNLLNDFVQSSRKDLADLHAAIGAADLGTATRAAHRIKGAAGLIGAVDVHRPAAAAEAAARGGDAQALAAQAGELVAALDILAVWVEG